MAQQYESGWENLDGHPDITKRPRPMFDAAGNPVTSIPEPEPLTAAERAMFDAMEAGRPGNMAPTVELVSQDVTAVAAHMISREAELEAVLVLIREEVDGALDQERSREWLLALAGIDKLLKGQGR
jgi:hypothetical protein